MAPIPFVGPFPPPVHGQAVATATIAALLEQRGLPLQRLDTGEAGAGGPWRGRIRRVHGVLRAAMACLRPGSRTAYLSVSANAGMVLTALLAGLARLGRKRPVLHHHTYAHVTARGAGMALLARLAGPSAIHMTICPAMSRELAATYPEICETTAFSNVDAVDRALLDIPRSRNLPRTLGFLSNLTLEKGVERAIAAFRLAHAHGLADSLVLAGPCRDIGARAAIDAAGMEFGDRLHYLGPVSGTAKLNFFASIDLFLFPSLYRNETQGIVNLEALAAGLPVIAYGLCCIPGDLDDPACTVLEPGQPFDTAVTAFLQDLAPRYPAACQGARARFHTLARAHEAEINHLAAILAL
ncbi:glycosyltransferase [Devosia ginsengisoli]|uniref:glycosyltransferase family 4 protein n=1 Tax=Devosia ginsengisoli TaxID=400770 RepID=UPI0026EF1D18|nr:glycosyltransferase [Devosia ginsengisoli]MCR6673605.1 glycosyltransferase [Devosia ginsengisoli]